jgi:endonuclease/exonuclease/phosphatase family metal-dependent hydrolase
MAQDIKVMSYNIRLDVQSDGENRWDLRRNEMSNMLNYYAPDFLGMQEVLEHQRQFLLTNLPDYRSIGVGREDGKAKGEYSCIFYRNDQYQLLQQATFWLSTTPDTVSVGWDAALPRVCTYGLFKHKASNKLIWVFNTHFDHMGATARYESARLIYQRIQQATKAHAAPVVMMGDLNSRPNEAPSQYLDSVMVNARTISKQNPLGPADTWDGFAFNKKPEGNIDYIFLEKNSVLQTDKFITITHSYDLKYPSDHLPVMAHLSFKTKK